MWASKVRSFDNESSPIGGQCPKYRFSSLNTIVTMAALLPTFADRRGDPLYHWKKGLRDIDEGKLAQKGTLRNHPTPGGLELTWLPT